MRLLAVVLFVGLALALPGCFSPQAIDGTFACVSGSGSSQCPPDQQCACGLCWFDPTSHARCPDGAAANIDAVPTTTTDAPASRLDAPLSGADGPPGGPDAATTAIDAPLEQPDAQPEADARSGTPDARVSVPDARPSIPDAPPPVPDAAPDAPAGHCGNGVCENGINETCLTCTADCGGCLCTAQTVCLLKPGGSNCANCPQCVSCTCNGVCQKDALGVNDCVTCPSDCPGQCP